MITSTAFVDLSAANDSLKHKLLIQNLYNIAKDSTIYHPEPATKQNIICVAEQ